VSATFMVRIRDFYRSFMVLWFVKVGVIEFGLIGLIFYVSCLLQFLCMCDRTN